MTTSPASILAAFLVSELLFSEHSGSTWPLFQGVMPSGRSEVGVVRDTEPVSDGRILRSGEVIQHPGVQVRVRSLTYSDGWSKLATVSSVLSGVSREVVDVGGIDFLIHSVSQQGGVLFLGQDSETRLFQFSLNLVLTLAQVDLDDILAVSPASVSVSETWPTSASSQTVVVTNSGPAAMDWTASLDVSWASVSPSSGTLAPGASVNLTVAFSSLEAQTAAYSGVLTVTGSGLTETVAISRTVAAPSGLVAWLDAQAPATLTLEAAINVSTASWSSGTVTLTTASAHSYAVGQQIVIAGVSPSGYNGTVVLTAASGSSLSYSVANDPGAYASGGTVVPFERRISSWASRIGSHVFTNAVLATQPRKSVPGVRFDATTFLLSVAEILAPAEEHTVILVGQGNGDFFGASTAFSNNSFLQEGMKAHVWNQSVSWGQALAPGDSFQREILFHRYGTDGIVSAGLHRSAEVVGNQITYSGTTQRRLGLHSRNLASGSSGLNEILEILFWNRKITSAELNAAGQFLAAKYGMTWSDKP